MRSEPLLLLLAMVLSSCAPHAPARRGRRPGDVELVAQWSLFRSGDASGFGTAMAAVDRCRHAEALIEREGGDLYVEDGNVVGRGRCDIVLYTDRIDATAARLVGLMRTGKLPGDLRVGVAVSAPVPGYRVVYPASLTRFDP